MSKLLALRKVLKFEFYHLQIWILIVVGIVIPTIFLGENGFIRKPLFPFSVLFKYKYIYLTVAVPLCHAVLQWGVW